MMILCTLYIKISSSDTELQLKIICFIQLLRVLMTFSDTLPLHFFNKSVKINDSVFSVSCVLMSRDDFSQIVFMVQPKLHTQARPTYIFYDIIKPRIGPEKKQVNEPTQPPLSFIKWASICLDS